jgi:hypothetical protein
MPLRDDGTGLLHNGDFKLFSEGGHPLGLVYVEVSFDPPSHTRLPINDTAQSTRAKFAGVHVIKPIRDIGEEPHDKRSLGPPSPLMGRRARSDTRQGRFLHPACVVMARHSGARRKRKPE